MTLQRRTTGTSGERLVSRMALLAFSALVPVAASAASKAASIQTGSAGGLQYQYMIGPGGCSQAQPCQIVEYLHYLGGEGQVPNDLQNYFNDAFFSAHPNTIVVAPQINGSTNDNNWGGVQSGVSPNGQAAVAAVQQIESQYPTNPNSVVLTGGSMGGIGTEALMQEYGPKGTVSPGVYAGGVAYDGATYNTDPASQQAALCGVPLIVQHGTADTTVRPGPDNTLAQTLAGCPGFSYTQVPDAGHGTWGASYSDGSQLSQVMLAAADGNSQQMSPGSGTSISSGNQPISSGSNQQQPNADGSIPKSMTSTGTGGNQNSTPCPPAAGTAVASTKSNTDPSTTTTSPKTPTQADGKASTSPTASDASSNAKAAPSATSSTTPSSSATPFAASGTRDPAWIPFASDSIFNLPLGLNASWQQNDQLSSAGVAINTPDTGWNQNIYASTANDPVVQVQSNGGAGGGAGNYTMHLPASAVPAPGTDNTLTVYDASSNQWCSMGGVQLTGNGSATAQQASCEDASGSGIQTDGSNWDQGVGAIRAQDLQAGTIHHMLRVEVPSTMAAKPTATTSLVPNAWPQTMSDGCAISGNGCDPYSGSVPYGVTIGIPALAQEPPEIAANPGADMLWRVLQTHGAMIRDTTGTNNSGKVTFQTDQNVSGSDPIIQGMMQYGPQVMAHAMILANQGPNSVNGGGTPIVPLIPPVAGQASVNSGDYGSVQGTGCSAPGNVNSQLSVDNLAYRAAQNHPPQQGKGTNRKTGQSSPGGLLGAPNGQASDPIQAAMDGLYKAMAGNVAEADKLSNDATSTGENQDVISTLMDNLSAESAAIKAMVGQGNQASDGQGSLVSSGGDAVPSVPNRDRSPTSDEMLAAALKGLSSLPPDPEHSTTSTPNAQPGSSLSSGVDSTTQMPVIGPSTGVPAGSQTITVTSPGTYNLNASSPQQTTTKGK